jgi:hypothetical protein
LHFVTNGADFKATPATGALGGINVAGFLFQGGREIAGLARNFFQFSKGEKLDVGVPADLDQLGGNNSHGTVIGGKGLVDLGHGTADGGAFFNEMNIIAGICQIQRCLHPGNAAANNHYRP